MNETAKSLGPVSPKRKKWIYVVPIVLIVVLFLTISISPFVTLCADDDRIPSATRKGPEEFALQFVKASTEGKLEEAYSMLTKSAQQEQGPADFNKILSMQIRPLGPFKDLKIAHTYMPFVYGLKTVRVICGSIADPRNYVSVTAKPFTKQAHVIVRGNALNNRWVFVVWIVREWFAWKVQFFQANPDTLADKSEEFIRNLARQEKDAGHQFNAAILYSTVGQLAFRGPHLQTGEWGAIQEEISQLQLEPELANGPPFAWKTVGREFKVWNVGPHAIGGKIYLQIGHEVDSWSSESQVDGWNKELIGFLESRFPEYEQVFAGIIIRAQERGSNRGYGTVQENKMPPSWQVAKTH